MSFLDILRYTAIALSFVVIVAGMALLLVDPSRLEGLFGGGSGLPPIDFATLQREDPEKSYLACPPQRCPNARPDATSPAFDISVERLRNRLLKFVDGAAGVRTERLDMERLQFVFLAPVPGEPAPDVVTVRLYPAEGAGSTLAVYSRTVIGTPLRERHERRVKRWLAALTPVG